jgi:HD-GYP domain-containing protein (c-di-GMP phosphodiesterase class II)
MAVNSIINILTSELGNAGNSYDAQKKVEESTYNISLERLTKVGIDEFTIQIVDESIKSMAKSVSEKAALGKFLKFMMDNKASYAYANSFLTCLTMTNLLKILEWESDAIKEQVTMICFFHNIGLLDENALKIYSNQQLEALSLTKEEKYAIKVHALNASGIIANYPKIPHAVITIIKEHHGSPTGTDFPDIPNAQILPMSKCFMVCEYFAHEIIMRGANIKKNDISEIVAGVKKKFSSGAFLEFVRAIEKMTSV